MFKLYIHYTITCACCQPLNMNKPGERWTRAHPAQPGLECTAKREGYVRCTIL